MKHAWNARFPAALLCAALVAAVFALYSQVGNHPFFIFDELDRVTSNPHIEGGITGQNILWAFTSVEGFNWHPVTWLSHLSLAHFFGMNPRAHHLANVLVHAASTLLLFVLLSRLTAMRWQSLVVAALFAVHPLHVESVAWVAERKDVLSALFWFLTILLYAEYVSKPRLPVYLLTLVSYILGLMSKPMLVTLPVVLLLLDFWPLKRYACQETGQPPPLKRLLAGFKEKLPFFACALCSGIITIHAQSAGGVLRGLKVLPLQLRLENALVAYVKYLGKILLPLDLAVLYPYPAFIPFWQAALSLVVLLLVSAAVVRSRSVRPYLFVGWFWFLIALIPVIGLIQVGGQSMADRYAYIPAVGLYLLVSWGVADAAAGLQYRRSILTVLAAVVLMSSAALTWKQLGYWRDSITLFQHALRVTVDNAEAHYNLGRLLQDKGYLDAAVLNYQEAVRINPVDVSARLNMGVCLQAKGADDAAIQQYTEVLKRDPDNYGAHTNLGLALQTKGALDEAIVEFQLAVRVSPASSDAHSNLGNALMNRGYLAPAMLELREAIRINPDNSSAHNNLGIAFAKSGNMAAANSEYRKALLGNSGR